MTAGGIVAVVVVVLLWLLSTPKDDPELDELAAASGRTIAPGLNSTADTPDANTLAQTKPFVLPTTPIAFDTATEQKQLLEVVEKMADHQPNNETAMVIAAITYAELLQTDKALDYFSRALKINPNNTEALAGQSKVLLQQGHVEQATKNAEQATPDDLKHQASFRSFASSTYGMVASIHTRLGDYTQAERLLRHALELDPAMSKNEMLLVDVFRKTERIPDAITVLQHLLVVQPDDLVNAHNLASLAVQQNQLPLAEQALTHLADHDTTGEGHAVLAQFLLRAGKSRQALERAKVAAERSPTVDSYLVLISAYRAMGDEDNAQQTLKKAKLIAPGDQRL